jgi:hypothetical protein
MTMRTRVPFAILAVFVLGVAGACGDQVQKAKPPEKPGTDLPANHPEIGHGGAHGGATRPAGGGHGDPFADSSGKPAMAPAQAADPERVVYAGELSIDPTVPLGEKYTIYITTVYSAQENAPVLIKRYDTPKFPFQFEIREKDVGMGARQSDRPLYLRAMISDTGDAMKRRNRTTSDVAYPLFTKDIKLTIKPDAPK